MPFSFRLSAVLILFFTVSGSMAAPLADYNSLPQATAEGSHSSYDLWSSLYLEEAVASRFALEPRLRTSLLGIVDLKLAASFLPLEQVFPYLLGFEVALPFRDLGFALTFALQHQRWTDFNTSENRVLLALASTFFGSLDAFAGVAGRAPRFRSAEEVPFTQWSSTMPELNLVYRAGWSTSLMEDVRFRIGLGNYERMFLFNPTNVHFSTQLEYSTEPTTTWVASFSTGLKGISGIMYSLPQFNFNVGLRRAL